ncbi:hypothetical protein DCCM_0306 [Desulfocucumis palustris]|uniref:Uncharacterized protein n=1 Tax=Desulfocucumis palustris TaxID=1898651 RepID=A0A2L2X7H4_9FIRM|nr:hypothetical protein DCCM_0306 [Desulfocucumis palustris]
MNELFIDILFLFAILKKSGEVSLWIEKYMFFCVKRMSSHKNWLRRSFYLSK